MKLQKALRLRTIREEHCVSEAIDKAKSKYPRIDEVFDGLKWRLARDPESGFELPNTDSPKYLIKPDPPLKNLPIITILYEFDAFQVNILDVKISSKS